MSHDFPTNAEIIVRANVKGEIFECNEGLSFWGGVDPGTGCIIDVHHPNHGNFLSTKFILMPTSRGSCSGSGVLLQLAQNGLAPSALIFHETEEILTLGAIVADQLFDKQVAVLRVSKELYSALAMVNKAEIFENVFVSLTYTPIYYLIYIVFTFFHCLIVFKTDFFNNESKTMVYFGGMGAFVISIIIMVLNSFYKPLTEVKENKPPKLNKKFTYQE